MGTDRVAFRVQDIADETLEPRLRALERWCAPLGGGPARVRREGDVVLGSVDLEGSDNGPIGGELRWAGATLGLAGVKPADAGPTTLYSCGQVVASHAVAAALLATGEAVLDEARLPELVAAEFVGGGATLLRGVRALAAAPLEPVRSRDASAVAERVLLGSLAARLQRSTTLQKGSDPLYVSLGLTAGADSRVVAVALAELGVAAQTFTWGTQESQRAAEIAGLLGFEHVTLPHGPLEPAAAIAAMRAGARWSEGAARLSPFGRQRLPPGDGPIITGSGGEVGRAFWYRLIARNGGRPRLSLDRRLSGADAAARSAAQDAGDAWVGQAHEQGFRGWSALDAAYAQQRLTAWGRSVLPRTDRPFAAAFATPELLGALASLPLEDKLTDGFHRRFVADRRPELHLRAPRGQRSHVPGPARRVAAAVRAQRRSKRAGGAGPDPWPLAALWTPETRAFVDEHVAAWPVLDEVFGTAWTQRLRTRFAADDPDASQTILRLAGPALLHAELQGF